MSPHCTDEQYFLLLFCPCDVTDRYHFGREMANFQAQFIVLNFVLIKSERYGSGYGC